MSSAEGEIKDLLTQATPMEMEIPEDGWIQISIHEATEYLAGWHRAKMRELAEEIKDADRIKYLDQDEFERMVDAAVKRMCGEAE